MRTFKRIKSNSQLQPVKPTAVRATSTNLNSSSNSTLNSSGNSATSTPSSKPVLVSSTPSKASSIRDNSPIPQIPTSGNFAAVAANSISSKSNTTSSETVPTSVISSSSQSVTPSSTVTSTIHHIMTTQPSAGHIGHVRNKKELLVVYCKLAILI